MTLKSSEIKNFSWRISTILKSVVASASYLCTLPLVVRPMMTTKKLFLKIVFDSPEFNRSIVFSMWTSMTKKMNWFLRHFIIRDWIFSWFNIGPNSFPNRYGPSGRAGRISSLWFCFGLWSTRKTSAFVFNAYSSNCTSEVSCSLLFKFVTNLFKPWEILTHEWERPLFTDSILISTSWLLYK